MNKYSVIHLFKKFIVIYIIFLFKFIYLFAWEWFKYDVFYWFDDAFSETFKWSLFPFFIYMIYFLCGKKVVGLISFAILFTN